MVMPAPSGDYTPSSGLFCCGESLDTAQQRIVFLARPDGDADFVGQARLVEVSDENTLLLEGHVGFAAAAVGSTREDEIGLRGQDVPTHLRQFAGYTLALGSDVVPGAFGVVLILEGGRGGDDGDGVAGIGVLSFIHFL